MLCLQRPRPVPRERPAPETLGKHGIPKTPPFVLRPCCPAFNLLLSSMVTSPPHRHRSTRPLHTGTPSPCCSWTRARPGQSRLRLHRTVIRMLAAGRRPLPKSPTFCAYPLACLPRPSTSALLPHKPHDTARAPPAPVLWHAVARALARPGPASAHARQWLGLCLALPPQRHSRRTRCHTLHKPGEQSQPHPAMGNHTSTA